MFSKCRLPTYVTPLSAPEPEIQTTAKRWHCLSAGQPA